MAGRRVLAQRIRPNHEHLNPTTAQYSARTIRFAIIDGGQPGASAAKSDFKSRELLVLIGVLLFRRRSTAALS